MDMLSTSRTNAKPLAMGLSGAMLVMVSVVLGITLNKHKVAGSVTAMTVLTSLLLLVPYYQLCVLQTEDGRGRTVLTLSVAFIAWLILFAIVAGQAEPISESFENIPYVPHHHHHAIQPEPVQAVQKIEPAEIPVLNLEAFEEEE